MNSLKRLERRILAIFYNSRHILQFSYNCDRYVRHSWNNQHKWHCF
jgi:hypothetical protein